MKVTLTDKEYKEVLKERKEFKMLQKVSQRNKDILKFILSNKIFKVYTTNDVPTYDRFQSIITEDRKNVQAFTVLIFNKDIPPDIFELMKVLYMRSNEDSNGFMNPSRREEIGNWYSVYEEVPEEKEDE